MDCRKKMSNKIYFAVTILGLLISNALPLPQGVKFGGKTNADRNKKVAADLKPRFGLEASVLGKI